MCSTGLIGVPMPMAPIEAGIPAWRRRSARTVDLAAEAILTTDTVRKEARERVELADGTTVTVGGMAKGAAMLAPSMATMLAASNRRRLVDSLAAARESA